MDLLIEGHSYTTNGNLDTFTQLHIARKLQPAMGAVTALVDPDNAEKNKNMLSVILLSYVSDQDAEYIIKKCLAVVMRRDSGTSAKVMTKEGHMMYSDMSMSSILELTMAVVEENLGDFFRTSLASLTAEKQTPNT